MQVLETIERDDVVLFNTTHETLFTTGKLDLRADMALSGWGAVGCLGMWVVILITLLGGVAFGIITQREFNLTGVVTEATVTTCITLDGQGTEIVYTYSVDGRSYSGSETHNDITCDTYGFGRQIDIRYLPSSPDESRWRNTPNLLPLLFIFGFGLIIGVPFVTRQAIVTYRGFRRRQCVEKMQDSGYIKRGTIITTNAVARSATYEVITHTGETLTGEARVTAEQKLPRKGASVVVVYADANCHRVL